MKSIPRILPGCIAVLAWVAFLPLLTAAQANGSTTILHAAEAAKVLPDSVFFRGRSATTQSRNAGGVRFSDDMYILATLVDTSGYSTGVQERYQGYLLAEVPVEVGGHPLPAGAYGVGFTGGHFHVMDIGDHELLQADSTRDAQMPRPVPLQVLDGPAEGAYRLCFGRQCVNFRRAR